MPATQNDLPPSRRSEISSPQTLEAVLNHELGHATEDHTGGLAPAADASYKREAGWVPLHNPPSDKPDDWALKGKDGFLYRIAGPPGNEKWMRLEGGAGYDANGNYAGHYLDHSGKRVGDIRHSEPSQAFALDTESMRRTAKVAPVGPYFPNAQEELAEALRAYRTSPATRAAFRAQNTALYKVADRLDRLHFVQ